MASNLLSYKQYKLLNETLGSPITLGLARPTSLGLLGNRLTPEELEAIELEEGKKKKKKMDDGDEVEIDAETGDGEVVDDEAAPPKDKPEEYDDEGGCGCGKFSCKKCKKMKNEAKKNMCDDEDVEDTEDEDVEDDDVDDEENVDDIEGGELGMMKKKMKKAMKKNAKKGMKKEEADWWNSVYHMMSANPDQKFSDGFTTVSEESLLPPQHDPNEELDANQPKPGELGFAPVGRVG